MKEVRLADWGPRYKETPPDPLAPGSPVPAEPFNTYTAALFLVIVGYWLWRIWGRWRTYPFVACCLPILLTGSLGGTLYHALRTDKIYFLLDLIPILVLGALGALYLLFRLAKDLGWVRTGLYSLGLMGLFLFMNGVLFRQIDLPNANWWVNLSYASQAVLLLLPMAVVLLRSRFRHGRWVIAALLFFGLAWFCRLVDSTPWDTFPVGTHWLWHTFGAMTTQSLIEYFARLEGEAHQQPEAEHFSG